MPPVRESNVATLPTPSTRRLLDLASCEIISTLMATSFPELRLEHLLALMRLRMFVSGVYLLLLLAVLLQMEYRHAARLQSMRGLRHGMFLLPLVVEELCDFAVGLV